MYGLKQTKQESGDPEAAVSHARLRLVTLLRIVFEDVTSNEVKQYLLLLGLIKEGDD